MHLLEQLKKHSRIVADSGDFESVRKFKPVDLTTNPSLIYAASQDHKYVHLMDEALAYAHRKSTDTPKQIHLALERLFINFGLEILKIIPGRVSTEVDTRLSFDTEGIIKKARELIAQYKESGIDRDRVLVDIAATWEGIKAAETLSKEGIHCNMTLVFSMAQAIACAEAGVQLISPLVGRVLEGHLQNQTIQTFTPEEGPGVLLVNDIYNYYKKFGYKTEIMGTGFKNTWEILALSGCDLLSLSPQFLTELEKTEGMVEKKLDMEKAKASDVEKMAMDQKKFRWLLNENIMAAEKLAEGIRKFTEDMVKLESILLKKHIVKYETL